ncbi:MAG: hypothetical protein V2I33_26375 [Kangiellaceae bacterium]|jgi:hypothetical protein|nr:hypothetical protein [Kangiellaceae bacterium]
MTALPEALICNYDNTDAHYRRVKITGWTSAPLPANTVFHFRIVVKNPTVAGATDLSMNVKSYHQDLTDKTNPKWILLD